MRRTGIILIAILLSAMAAAGCTVGAALPEKGKTVYQWSNVTGKAQFPEGYNYPVFVMNGELRAINNGGWVSKDGRNWTKTPLPDSGLNSAYQKFILFDDAIYALGTMTGNYLDMKLTSKISRTRDLKTWEILATRSNLPERVFYGATVFKDKIWLFGGWDGNKYYNDAWSSADGVNWVRAAEKTAWSPRNIAGSIAVFKNRIWIIGGSVIDGEKTSNPDSDREIWSSADGVNWTQVKVDAPRKLAGTPVVFDGKLWLAGANRGNGFESGMLYTEEGANWREMTAPWTPRGGVAVWVFGDKLYLTGGKYSHTVNGEIKFVYSNDVWAMERKSE
jgi:hypothetical protein